MAPSLLSEHLMSCGLESHIHDLLRQKDLLQNISSKSFNNIDFGDILETYSLLVSEIDKLQRKLRSETVITANISEEEEETEEEEEIEAIIKKYRINEVIMEKDGSKRPVEKDDLLIRNNKGVERAFKVIAGWHKQYKMLDEYKDKGEPSGFPIPTIFVLKEQELILNQILNQLKGRWS